MSFREYAKERFASYVKSAKNTSLVGKLQWQSVFVIMVGACIVSFTKKPHFMQFVIGWITLLLGTIELCFWIFVWSDYLKWKKRRVKHDD